MTFTLHMIPPSKTSQQKGLMTIAGKARTFKKPEIKAIESTLAAMLHPYRPSSPITGPVQLTMQLVWPYRKSERKAIVREGKFTPKVSKPDWDNVPKLICDVMTTLGFWIDDAQIYQATVTKHWGPECGIHIGILEGDQ